MSVLLVFRQPDRSSMAVATLTCEEEVKSFHCCAADVGEARVAVVGQDGGLFLYRFPLSSLPASPLTASFTVQYVTSPPKVRFCSLSKGGLIVFPVACYSSPPSGAGSHLAHNIPWHDHTRSFILCKANTGVHCKCYV